MRRRIFPQGNNSQPAPAQQVFYSTAQRTNRISNVRLGAQNDDEFGSGLAHLGKLHQKSGRRSAPTYGQTRADHGLNSDARVAFALVNKMGFEKTQ